MSSNVKPRVLLTNDDGPPSHESPYIYGLYRHLTEDLSWDVKVVVPSSQKSWIGHAYHIKEIVKGRYYYPRGPDGMGETSETSRPLKEGEIAEWVLLDGTPATCANIGLHNLYQGEIDLLISGPNLGRNSSAAFALASGTVGAALSSSLSNIRAIALSYGTVAHPVPVEYYEPAHRVGARIAAHLWANWASAAAPGRRGVDLYNVNVPMVEGLLAPEGMPVCWARIWRNTYGRLFRAHAARDPAARATISAAGPDSPDEDPRGSGPGVVGSTGAVGGLVFKFAPDLSGIISPELSSLPVGSDGWVLGKGWASVTPICASFAEPEEWTVETEEEFEEKVWKIKL